MLQSPADKPKELVLTEEMVALVQRAEGGDHGALPALRKLLADKPDLWAAYGDLAAWSARSWLDLIAGGNLMMRESLTCKLAQLQDELAGDDTSPIEHLLIQRVTSSWLMANYADAHLAQLRTANAGTAQLRVAERFTDRAHHRYLSAIKQLAQVRKLLRPLLSPIQVASRIGDRDRGVGSRRDREVPIGVGVEN